MKPNQPTDKVAPITTESHSIFRILDANLNRATEGIRVVEDVLRMVRNDAVLARQAKQIRHEITDVLGQLDTTQLVRSRNVEQDVGRTTQTEQEYQRGSTDELLKANLSRTQQSLRVIEECLKTMARPLALRVEALRYEVYQLEFAADASARSRDDFAGSLYVLVDGLDDEDRFGTLCRELISAGADWIQLRDKKLSDRELLSRAEVLKQLTQGNDTRWIMNDRPDLAALAGAHGVHLGQDDVSVSQARRIAGPDLWIGVSVHSLEQAEQAARDGANYIGVGPIFESATKKFEQLKGLELITRVSTAITLPFFAIGGITLENIDDVLAAGARRIAVSHAVTHATSPGSAIRSFQSRLRRNDSPAPQPARST